MNLYLLTQSQMTGYDTFDAIVVAAEYEEDAKNIFPRHYYENWEECRRTWASSPEQVTAEFLGQAKEGTERGVILASFNAG